MDGIGGEAGVQRRENTSLLNQRCSLRGLKDVPGFVDMRWRFLPNACRV
jgi:hypothetical protein